MTNSTKNKISELVFATHNGGKLRELKDMVAPLNLKVYSASELQLIEPEETAETFEGNATDKAMIAAKATSKPCLADDSGLVIPALNGAPGVYSARWGELNPDGSRNFTPAYERIQRELGEDNPEAYYYCVLALAFPEGEIKLFQGRTDGRLTFPPRGSQGFGYDPIFIPQGQERTFAEMTLEEKKQLSARSQAFQKFWLYLTA